MYKQEEISYKGCSINIYLDEHLPESPRDWDNLTTMLCFHKRYNLGDIKESNYWDSARKNCRSWEELWAEIQKGYDIIVAKPLYLYDHSGISISTGSFIGRAHHARWDSGQIGFVFITRESVKKIQGWKQITAKRKKKLKQWLQAEVKTYDQYLRGEVYWYDIEGPNGEHIDSCSGFYGSDWEENGLFEYAKPAVDHYIKQQRKQYFNRLKDMIRNHVPLQVRNSQLTKPSVLCINQ